MTGQFILFLGLFLLSILLAQSQPKFSSKLPKAGWLRQRIFDNEIELEIPRGSVRMKSDDNHTESDCPFKVLQSESFLLRDQASLRFYMTAEDFPMDDSGPRPWSLIETYFPNGKVVESGFFQVDGKLIYFFSQVNKRFHYLQLFAEHRGKIVHALMKMPTENLNMWEKTSENIVMSIRFARVESKTYQAVQSE